MKYTISRALAVALVGASLVAPFVAGAVSVEELQVRLRTLLSQIGQMQQPANAIATSEAAGFTTKHQICSVLSRNLSRGSRGDDVQSLQEFLQQQGHFSGTATGYFGVLTAKAVASWQAKEGIAVVGAVGPKSRERMKLWCGGSRGEPFNASPSSGQAPLTVTFTTWLSGFHLRTISYVIDFGDGSGEQAADCLAPADACISPGQNSHTYTQNGTYIATLTKITNACAGQTVCNMMSIQPEVIAKQHITVGPVACTMEYNPVCGAKQVVCIKAPCNPVPTTYGNKCAMNADGAVFLYAGECKTTSINPAYDPRCKVWYDGCNTCSRQSPGSLGMCTMMACIDQGTLPAAYCKAYFDDSNSGNKPPTISGLSGATALAVGETGTWTINASDPENGQLSYAVYWDNVAEGTDSFVASAAHLLEIVQNTTFTHAYSTAGTHTITVVVTDNAHQSAKTSTTVVVGASVACTKEYIPVCGRPTGCMNTCPPGMYCAMMCQQYPLQTYGNKCQLDASGAEFVYAGQCTGSAL